MCVRQCTVDFVGRGNAYQLFSEIGESEEVLFSRDVEFISVFYVDRD